MNYYENLLPEFPHYYISPCGEILSKKGGIWKKLKPYSNKSQNGRYYASIMDFSGKKRNMGVHKLVAFAYIGPKPKGMVVCHNNGNPMDNTVSNLRYDTLKSNSADSLAHGTRVIGEKTHNAVLTERIVVEIFSLAASGLLGTDIAKTLGFSNVCIQSVIARRNWKHVKIDPLILEKVSKKPYSRSRIINKEDVLYIFSSCASGKTATQISEEMSVSLTTILQILKRKSWKKVPVAEEILSKIPYLL